MNEKKKKTRNDSEWREDEKSFLEWNIFLYFFFFFYCFAFLLFSILYKNWKWIEIEIEYPVDFGCRFNGTRNISLLENNLMCFGCAFRFKWHTNRKRISIVACHWGLFFAVFFLLLSKWTKIRKASTNRNARNKE